MRKPYVHTDVSIRTYKRFDDCPFRLVTIAIIINRCYSSVHLYNNRCTTLQYQFTPLYCAAKNGHSGIVSLLLEKGAIESMQVSLAYNPLVLQLNVRCDRCTYVSSPHSFVLLMTF
jgi:ankyrin repeat protein